LGLPADGSDSFQDFRRGSPRFQPALSSELIDQAIRKRVAERNAELKDVHTDAIESQTEFESGLEAWVAGADVYDESFPACASKPGKTFHDAIHAARSMAKAGARE
jgi:hypothetical protein